ncbi:MAG: SusC/RagA family TonB-linked outer membrane protein [Dysgonamonadaceae bacterium]|jgi:TonB-linked SusC/RagA family outer membrane protein|nr:SusC/RagA family TonB-linked outer membrane protein [Dysgonamonadaceae bacterium]
MKQSYNKNKKRRLAFLLLGMFILWGTGKAAAQEIAPDTTSTEEVSDCLDMPYGSVSKDTYLGSAATIYTDKLTKMLSPTIIPSLAGRLSGVSINQYAGTLNHITAASATSDLAGWIPNFSVTTYSDNTQFNLRLRGTAPVVMVDGVQRELFSFDPEAIESVSIQKDALSSLLLGMQSARGMLVITTKKPEKEGFQLSFTARYGIQQPLNMPKPLQAYQYAYLLNEALQNDGNAPAYTPEDFAAYRNHTSAFTHPDINWYDQVLKSSSTIQSYNLNASGGGKIAHYFVSLGYMNEEGLFRTSAQNSYNTNSNYERYLITSKINVNVTDDLQVGLTLVGRIEDGNQPGGGTNGILNAIYTTPNNAYPITNPNGSYGGNISYPNNLWAQTVSSGYISDNTRDAVANLSLNYDISKLIKGLSFKAIGSASTQSRSALFRTKQMMSYQYIMKEGVETYDPFGATQTQSNSFTPVFNYQYMYGQAGLDYERTFKQHTFGASAFADIRQVTVNYNLPDKPVNVYGKVKYDYAQKYLVEAAVNRSYYNGYAPGKQWGTFYAFGLGWNVGKENFLKDVTWLNQWKLRGVYGDTGNGIGNTGYYTWRQSFSENGIGFYPHGTARTNVTLLAEVNPLPNINLTWEKARKFNVGTDISVWDKRLSFTADYYDDYHYDLLMTRGKSIELIGMSYPTENIGEVSITGLELSVSYQDRIGDFGYFVSANWTQENSKLLFIDEQDLSEERYRRTGKSNGAIFGLLTDGFFTSQEEIQNSPTVAGYDKNNIRPGDVKYVDLDKSGSIDQYDQTVIGGDKPYNFFGLELGLEYKGWEFSALIQGVYNNDIYYADATYMAGFQSINQGYGQTYEHILNRWTPETAATAIYPRLSAGGNAYNLAPNNLYSSLWIQSGNYIRLKNAMISYTLPKTLSQNHLGGLKIKMFVAGQNLLTKAACDLFDPEVISFASYPIMRGFNMGINIKF